MLSAPLIQAIGVVLLIGTILCFVAGAMGLFGVPLLKEQWKGLTIAGSVLSLLLFAVTWTGILPHPSDAIFGPVVSGVLLLGLLVDLLLEHAVRRPRTRHTHRAGREQDDRRLADVCVRAFKGEREIH